MRFSAFLYCRPIITNTVLTAQNLATMSRMAPDETPATEQILGPTRPGARRLDSWRRRGPIPASLEAEAPQEPGAEPNRHF
jgi:hypothetical protein